MTDMKLFSSKKGEEEAKPMGVIIALILLTLLMVFVLFWWSGLGNKAISLILSAISK